MHRGKQQWRTYVLLGIVVAVGLALRLYRLCDRSIWFDEAFSWRLVQYPLGEMIPRITRDNTPPLYFILLKAWTVCFGDGLLAMRLLSVLLGTATIAAMFFFVREACQWCSRDRLAGCRTAGRDEAALFASLLVAISIFQIRWSWDVRPYVLGSVLALLSSWILLRALRSVQRSGRWWLAYAVSALLFAYTHYFALFTLAVQGAFALYVLWDSAGNNLGRLFRSRSGLQAAGAFSLVVLGWAAWVPFFFRQFHRVHETFWIAPLQQWEIAHTVYRMFVDPEDAFVNRTASLWALDLCVLGWVALLWRADRVRIFVAASALGPIGFAVLLDQAGIHLFLLRYFLFAHLFFLAGLAMLVCRIPWVPERSVVLCWLTICGLVLFWQFHEKANFPGRPGTHAAAEWILNEAGPDDPVVVNSAFCYLPLLYYLHDRGGCYLYRTGSTLPHYLGAAVIDRQDTMTEEQLARAKRLRIWFVESTYRVGAAGGFPPPGFGHLIHKRYFPDAFHLGSILVYQYGKPDDPQQSLGTSARQSREEK